MERVIERMMDADFKDFVSTNILKPADELYDNGHLVDEVRIYMSRKNPELVAHHSQCCVSWVQ